ncbi:MAG: hypothetical protein U0Q12_25280 [Vicinamibacterales bacterium]
MCASSKSYEADEFEDLVDLIREEWDDVLGSTVTVAQLRALWSLDEDVAARAISRLIELGVLAETAPGTFAHQAHHAL